MEMGAGRTRRTVVAVVVAALVAGAVAGWLEWRHAHRFHEHVTGARGAFPAAVGDAAPAAPDRVLRRTTNSYGVMDGAVSIDGTNDGIVARNLRTGQDYWHYGRGKTVLGRVALTGGGDTVATWWQDGLVVGIDVHSGKPRWHAKVSYGIHNPAKETDFADFDIAGDLVVAMTGDRIAAFDEHSGKHVWNGAIPHGCVLRSDGAAAMRGAVIARAQCHGSDDESDQLLGFDVRRGTLRWRTVDGIHPLISADDHTLVTSEWTVRQTGAVIDVSGTKPVVTTRKGDGEDPTMTAGGGIVLGDHDADGVRLTAYGVTDGGKRWTWRPAKGMTFGRPLIADGRVYVVQQPSAKASPSSDEAATVSGADLVVLDAATGRQLHSTRLPSLTSDLDSFVIPSEARLEPSQAGHGVVAVGWASTIFTSGDTGDLLVLAE
jgi:hypothetical protein